jgi:hypothetical protein
MSARTPNDEPFELVSVQKTSAPQGSEGSDWFSYIISQGTNKITGYRQGNLTVVKESLQELIVGLNERRSPKRGRVQLTQTKKPPRTAAG